MRITRQAKEETRQRIVAAAARLFAERGFGPTTTRELAAEAGIAAGTLFNYFPSKESLATWILAEAATKGLDTFRAERRAGAGLEEELFAHAAAGLRELAPLRGWAGEVLGSTHSLRELHLEALSGLLADHGRGPQAAPVTLHLYWTLYLGVLSFWAHDESPHVQDTLAVLDRSLRLFVNSLGAGPTG